MTVNLSKQTRFKWHQQSPSRLYPQLPRPIVSTANEFEAMTHIVKHSHPWSQLCYSCNGVTQTQTKDGIFILPPEQALWIPAQVEHQQHLKNKVSNRSLYIDKTWSKPLGNKVRALTVDPLLKALILEISNWPEHYQQTLQTDRLVQVLIDRLAVAPSNALFMPTVNDNRLLPIIEMLNQNPANKLTIEQWSEKVGASSRTLNRLFNTNYGMGFSKWKQKLRILKSLDMLNAELPLNDIAYELGYESSSAFLTAFKKQLGCSPKKYLLKN